MFTPAVGPGCAFTLPVTPPQVLTTVVSDARELLEVRRSEASLKAQLADAHAKLKVGAGVIDSFTTSRFT